MMKHATILSDENPNRHVSGCPVNCLHCRYDAAHLPARWANAEMERDEQLEMAGGRMNRIVFVQEGTIRVSAADWEQFCLTPGHCIFLAKDRKYVFAALTRVHVVLLDFSNRITLCNRDCLSRLTFPESPSERPVLSVPAVLSEMIGRIVPIDTPCFHVLKEYELFMMMRSLYSAEELATFFHPVLRPGRDMRAFVESSYREAQGVEDFARMANMSESTFRRKFRDTFGTSVHRWLVQQRRKDLCEMIANGERDTITLAKGIGLTSQATLYQFCRRHFGYSISQVISEHATRTQ